jgi:hypothetical protein
MSAEEPIGLALGGGWEAGPVRIGDTVRRRSGRWTPAVHALLRHLESVGFDAAPRVLGVDGQGREVLSYIEGQPVFTRFPRGCGPTLCSIRPPGCCAAITTRPLGLSRRSTLRGCTG